MSFLAALLLAQAAGTTSQLSKPSPAVIEEMKQIGEKMGGWRGGVYKDEGEVHCRTEQSSGDEAIDTIRCAAMIRCLTPHVSEFDAIAESGLPEADRNKKMQAVVATTRPCLAETTRVGVRVLAEKRVVK